MAYFTPAELPDNRYYIFGKGGGASLAERYGIPLLGQIPLVQSIREAGDEGRPAIMSTESIGTTAFREAAEALAQQVAIRNASADKTKVVEIRM
jgi:ATP-binding protein involved in chromosome partitioning